MNRRGFLSALLGTASALALDPERALFVPGKKLISIPKFTPALLQVSIVGLHREHHQFYNRYITIMAEAIIEIQDAHYRDYAFTVGTGWLTV